MPRPDDRAAFVGARFGIREQSGQVEVRLGGRATEGIRRVGEVDALARRTERHAPRVVDAGEELLREGERPVQGEGRIFGIAPRAVHAADDPWHVR